MSRENPVDATVRDRLANSLLNTILLDIQEKASDRISAPLTTLSYLASEYRDDISVRKYLASGLYNAMVYAKQEGALQQHDAWLEELRQLVRSYPEDETLIKAAPFLDLGGGK